MGKIGVYDSGIGGVSVLNKIVELLPNMEYIYFSDSRHNPYGEKTRDEILEIVIKNVDFLIQKGCQIIVLACNTATAVAIDTLRSKFSNICFIGIEPAIKVVHDLDIKGKTLLFATKLTLDTERVQSLTQKYAPQDCIIYPCVGLAALIENRKTKEIEQYFNTHFRNFSDVSCVVLGCTHYPLIENLFQKYFKNAMIIDGSFGVAKQVLRKVEEQSLQTCVYSLEFIDTSLDLDKKKKQFAYFYQKNI